VSAVGPPPGREEGERIFAAVRRVLRLDEDLSGFYALAARDPDLSWGTKGAGRMVRSPRSSRRSSNLVYDQLRVVGDDKNG
jgi:hypothetical protein